MTEEKKEKLIRVVPRKEYVGWLIPLAGYGRFQPQSEEDYIDVPAKAKEILEKKPFKRWVRIESIKEDKNG